MAAPFAIPPTVAAPARATASFALVDVGMIARAARPPLARWRRDTWTGAACARLVVKTPAAAIDAASPVATSARSGSPDGLIPHASPQATNPGAAVTPDVMAGSRAAGGPSSRVGRG